MISLINRFTVAPTPRRRQVPQLTYAVGDIHGQGDLAHALIQAITDEIVARTDPAIVVFLGDYIDRGPHSRYVLDLLVSLQSFARIETHLLKGNHEDAMLAFLEGRDGSQTWLDFGGVETLRSYDVQLPAAREGPPLEACRQALMIAVPAEHKTLLESLELSFSSGDYFFAHAGADPRSGLDNQSPEDLMWIRGRFLDSAKGFEQVVVHGHTPTADVHADHRRIGIDTGAYVTGILTGLKLEGETREVIQAARTTSGPEIRRYRL